MSDWDRDDRSRRADDLCADLRDDDCDRDHDDDDRDRRRRRRRRLIPIGRVSVDCTPVSFETPGQARTVLSCPVSKPVSVPVTRTVNVQIPIAFGCSLSVPITKTVALPCLATVNLPPTLVPFPRLSCPPFLFPGLG